MNETTGLTRGSCARRCVALPSIAAASLLGVLLAPLPGAASTPPDVDPVDRLITTIAGTGEFGATGDGGPARQARLGGLSAIAVGPDGTVYVTAGNRIRAISPDGSISTFAGTGQAGASGDGGPATDATIDPDRFFAGLAVGPDGTVYFTDGENDRVRAIAPDGTIMTVAGTGREDVTADGAQATDTPLVDPSDVAVGPDGTVYFVEQSRVRTITADGTIATIADGSIGGIDDYVLLDNVAVAPDGTVYTIDLRHGERRLLAIDDGEFVAIADVPGRVRDLGVGDDGIVYAVGSGGLVAVDPLTGAAETLIEDAWPSVQGLGDGGPLAGAHLYQPTGIAAGPDRSVYIADYGSARVRVVSPITSDGPATATTDDSAVGSDRLATWAGYEGDGYGERGIGSWFAGPTHQREIALDSPGDVAIASDGTTFVADTDSQRVLAIDPDDGAVSVSLADDDVESLWPSDIAVHGNDELYVVDGNDDRVVRLDLADGDVEEIAVADPSGIAVADDGTVYVASGTSMICTIERAADTCDPFIDGGDDREESDNGVATDARLLGVRLDLAIGRDDALYVSDAWWIRRIDLSTGAVTVVAGTGIDGRFVEGAPAQDSPIRPSAITVAADGSVYFVDRNYVLRAVAPDGSVRTVANTDVGVGSEYGADDDPATPDPVLDTPLGLGADADGNVFVADTGHDLVRVVGDLEIPAATSTAGRNGLLFGVPAAVLLVLVSSIWLVRRRRAPVAEFHPR